MKNPSHKSDGENRQNENQPNKNREESRQKEKTQQENTRKTNTRRETTQRETSQKGSLPKGNRQLKNGGGTSQQDNAQPQQKTSPSPQTRRSRKTTSNPKTANANRWAITSAQSLTLTNKQGVTKITRHQNVKKTKTIIGKFAAEPQKQTGRSAGTRPSMARMIEVARNAEARRRAENELNQTEPAQEAEMIMATDIQPDISGRPDISGGSDISSGSDISGGPDISGKTCFIQDKDKNGKKTAPSGDDVKTAQVLKRAAEIARAKKDPVTKPTTYKKETSVSTHEAINTESGQKDILPKAKPSNRSQKWGSLTKRSHKKKSTAEQNSQQNNQQNTQQNQQNTQQNSQDNTQQNTQQHSPISTRQTRAQRVTEAMRRLKESTQQENIQPKRSQAQQRLTETLQRMNLNNPASPLLLVALTHPSYTFENPNMNKENNQRLEFLGDAVLDFIVGEYLYLEFPDKTEGELTKIRAAVVNESTLAQAARHIQLGQSLFLGRGEQVSGGRERPSILADALEALIGAVYLQEGFDAARQFVLDMLVPIIDEVNQDHYGDFKTLLQEVAQHDERAVSYRILDELGPDHNKSFTAGVFIQGVLKGKGTGRTKKEAEQLAAKLALENWEVQE